MNRIDKEIEKVLANLTASNWKVVEFAKSNGIITHNLIKGEESGVLMTKITEENERKSARITFNGKLASIVNT